MQLSSVNSPVWFDYLWGSKCPTRPTMSLVFNWGHNSMLPPIEVIRHFDFLELVSLVSIQQASVWLSKALVVASCFFQFILSSISELVNSLFEGRVALIVLNDFTEILVKDELSQCYFLLGVDLWEILDVFLEGIILEINRIDGQDQSKKDDKFHLFKLWFDE
jgi:hypothetical protein